MLAYANTVEIKIQLLDDFDFVLLGHTVSYSKFDHLDATLVLDNGSIKKLIGDQVFEFEHLDVIPLHPENNKCLDVKKTIQTGKLQLF